MDKGQQTARDGWMAAGSLAYTLPPAVIDVSGGCVCEPCIAMFAMVLWLVHAQCCCPSTSFCLCRAPGPQAAAVLLSGHPPTCVHIQCCPTTALAASRSLLRDFWHPRLPHDARPARDLHSGRADGAGLGERGAAAAGVRQVPAQLRGRVDGDEGGDHDVDELDGREHVRPAVGHAVPDRRTEPAWG